MHEDQQSPIQVQLDTSQEMSILILQIDYDIQDDQQLFNKYQSDFQSKLSKSFDETTLNREQEFKSLIKFIDQLAQDIKNEPQLQDLFNLVFLKRLVKYTSSMHVFQAKFAIILLTEIMARKIIANRLFHQRGSERIIVDLVNSLLNLKQQLMHTQLEYFIDNLLIDLNISMDKPYLQQAELTIKQTLKQINKINDFVNCITKTLSQCESIYQQYQLFSGQIQDSIYEYLLVVKQQDDKYTQLSAIMTIYEKYIFDPQFTIYMDTKNFKELKTYILKIEYQMILANMHKFYRTLSMLLNMLLILPNEVSLQKRAFTIIRVLYKYFPSIRANLFNPIMLVLRNLSLFLSKDTIEFKEATIFIYQLINASDYDDKLKKQLLEDEDLCFLRENKYYSVKALSYIDETQTINSLRELNVYTSFSCYQIINAATIYQYSLFVERSNSLVYWQFTTKDYDISFGLFKLNYMEDMNISDYQNEKNGVKSLIKIQRIDSHKQPVIGVTLITNPGLYRFVFDNSYSYLRSKQLVYNIHLMESKQ